MKYIIKKVISMIITLVVVSLCVFLAFSIIPGDPALKKLGTEASPELIAQTREQMGLNDPVIVRYFRWFGAFLQGDMGKSYNYSVPVAGMILNKIPITLTMAIMSFLLTIVVSIPLGIITAKHEGGMLDRVVTVINQIIMAVPPFFSGILITFIFGMVLKLFKPGGFISYSEDFAEDYTRTAYSRGNDTNGVLYRHVLKNALIPVITFLGMLLADMIAGSIVIEQVFGIPGISRILLTSISNRDYPVVEAIIMGIAMIVIVTNLLVDIIYRIVDPRIGIEE